MLYDKIKHEAKARGIPIYKLEQECGLSRGSICKWNEVSPSAEKVKKVAEYMGVTTDYLLCRKGGDW